MITNKRPETHIEDTNMNINRPGFGLLTPLAIATALAAGHTFAEDSRTEKLETMVVTATRAPANISTIAGTVQVVTSEQLKEQIQPGLKLSDSLEKIIPGMGPSTQAVTDATQSIRGRKILVLIDGIPQSDNRRISRQLSSIRAENIERIEVVSGASAIYGGGATGGIINFITKRPAADDITFATEAGVKIANGRLGAWNLNQSVTGRTGDFDYLLSGTFEQRDGLFDARGQRINPDPSQISRMDTDTKDVLVKLGYNFDDSKRLQVTGQLFRDEMDTDYAPDYGPNLVNASKDAPILPPVKGLNLATQPETNRDSLAFSYTDDDFFGSQLMTQAFYRTREARFYPYHLQAGPILFVNQSVSKASVYGLKVGLSTDLTDTFTISYGLDYDLDKGEQRGQLFDSTAFRTSQGKLLTPQGDKFEYGPDVDTTRLGVYLQSSWDIVDAVTVSAGWRHERASLEIEDYNPYAETLFVPLLAGTPLDRRTTLEGDTRKLNANLFNTGVVYRLNDEHQLFANFSQGFEVPDASRLLRNAVSPNSVLMTNPATPGLPPALAAQLGLVQRRIQATDVSNANLDAIETDSYELGWRGDFGDVNANAAVFYNESDKKVDFNADFSVDLLDQEKKVYGFELAGEVFLNDNWKTGGSYTFTEGRSYYKSIDKWLDLQANDVSPEKFVAFVGFEQGALNMRLQGIHFSDYDKGKQLDQATNTVSDREIEGYTTFDLMASYELPVGTVSAAVTNLTNRDYQTVYSQWARETYDGLSASKAQGRAYNLSYRVEY